MSSFFPLSHMRNACTHCQYPEAMVIMTWCAVLCIASGRGMKHNHIRGLHVFAKEGQKRVVNDSQQQIVFR